MTFLSGLCVLCEKQLTTSKTPPSGCAPRPGSCPAPLGAKAHLAGCAVDADDLDQHLVALFADVTQDDGAVRRIGPYALGWAWLSREPGTARGAFASRLASDPNPFFLSDLCVLRRQGADRLCLFRCAHGEACKAAAALEGVLVLNLAPEAEILTLLALLDRLCAMLTRLAHMGRPAFRVTADRPA